ncbi:MAG: hypothetical protein WCW78_00675 [Candidatus Paceibacterota bacterium]|jgi:hypothetical protein
MKKSLFVSFIAIFTAILFIGCSSDVKNIPPGYIAKILTPTGWEKDVREAGQVDIGTLDNEKRGNTLVLMEATSVTIKEQFMEANSPENQDKQDHRVMLKGGTPVVVDIYAQVSVPVDPELRNAAFAQITPKSSDKDERVKVINLGDIYDRFAKMSIRSYTRSIFAKYQDYNEVLQNYTKINAEISTMVMKVFKENKVPLELISASLSNVKPDQAIWEASNKQSAAASEVAAINMVGDAMRKNPGYLQFKQWETIEKIAGKGVNLTLIVGGSDKPVYTIPVGK